jgi:phage terminase large subunit GpA-like protein
MKLIKEGRKLHKKFRGTCPNCGSKFEAKRDELRIEYGDQREPGEFAHAQCTECKHAFVLYPIQVGE